VITLSGVAGGGGGGGAGPGGWGHEPRGAGLGDASTHFIQTFKKRIFQQKFRPKYAKKIRIFLEKKR